MRSRQLLYGSAVCLFLLALVSVAMALQPPPVPRAQEAAAILPASPPTETATTTPGTYFVVRVIDGDTVDVMMQGTTTRLRLIGMDTPEVVDPRKPVQCFGKEASAQAHKLLENQWVRLEYDAVSGVHDKYGRTLAYVFRAHDGLFYNEWMIRNGFAHEYDYQNQKYTYRANFRAAQIRAKEESLGFWSPETCNGNTTKPAGAS